MLSISTSTSECLLSTQIVTPKCTLFFFTEVDTTNITTLREEELSLPASAKRKVVLPQPGGPSSRVSLQH